MGRLGDMLDDRRVWLPLVLLVTVPLWLPAIPPLIDVPAHMGRFRIMTAGPLPSLAGFEFRWELIGNLGTDLLIMPLAPLIGVEAGTKLIMIMTLAIMATALLLLSHQVHGRIEPGVLFALPLVHAYPFQFGLMNFWFGAALALLALLGWIRMAAGWKRGLCFAAIACLLWLAHTVAWGLFGLMAFGSELARRRADRAGWLAAFWGAVLTCLPLALPLAAIATQTGSGAGATEEWFQFPQKQEFILSLFRDRWRKAELAAVAVVGVVGLAGLVWRRLPMAPVLLWPAVLCGAAFVLLPFRVFGSSYADMRVLPIGIILGLLAIGTVSVRLRALLTAVGLVFLVARVATTTASFALYDAAYRRELAAIAALPQGASVLVLTGSGCWSDWHFTRLQHLGTMATVRRDAFTNDHFVAEGAQTLRVIKPGVGDFAVNPSQLVLPAYCRAAGMTDFDAAISSFNRAAFDHVWVIDHPGGTRPADLERRWADGGSAVYFVRRNTLGRK